MAEDLELTYPGWYRATLVDGDGSLVAPGPNRRRLELLLPGYAVALGREVLTAGRAAIVETPKDARWWGEGTRFSFRNEALTVAMRGGLPGATWLYSQREELDLVDRSVSPGRRPRAEGTGAATAAMLARVDDEVTKLIEASGGKLTLIAARTRYFNEHPEVYASYRAAVTVRRGGAR